MKHVTAEELQNVAVIHPDQRRPPMTRAERLERWAELLQKHAERRLSPLEGTEFQRRQVRDQMRSINSPISVAANDPILRAEGLTGDTYGEARRSFELPDRQLHEIVCYCHAGDSMSGHRAERWVRAAIAKPPHTGLWGRLRSALGMIGYRARQ